MKLLLGILFSFFILSTSAQGIVGGKAKTDTIRANNGQMYRVENGDTMMMYSLSPITIYSLRVFSKKRDQKKYDKLVYHIKKVYPYAKRAGEVLREEEAKMAGMDKSDRKEHMKTVEKRIEKQFGPELKNLTFTQGRILLKLIDRETGYTSYELVDGLRGTFRAWFYDGIAGLFGYDLKGEFDVEQHLEDKYIDEVVRLIESGQISLK